MSIEANWSSRAEMAEYAEALSISTDDIMGVIATQGDPNLMVIYTSQTHEEEPVMWKALVTRDADDVIVKFGEPVEVPGGIVKLKAAIDRKMREQHGEGEPTDG